jgi:hypothetical protein
MLINRSSDYLRMAAECRALSRTMTRAEQRDILVQMAEAWEQLAQGSDVPVRAVPACDELEISPPEKQT